MNNQSSILMTAEQYLNWSEAQPEGRFELVDGELVMMSPERARHVRAKYAVYVALSEATKAAAVKCHVLGDGIGVQTSENTIREPDASVQIGGTIGPDSMLMPEPHIVVEVLSPSSERSDTGEKLAEYFSLPSVRHYLIVNAEKKIVIHHDRTADGHIETTILQDGRINFEPFGFSVAVTAMFGETDQ